MPKTKSGEIISWKEYFKRWKVGIDNITPYQKVRSEVSGSRITLAGFIVALIAVIIQRERIGLLAYGLILIFLGSVITTYLRYASLKQQMKLLKNFEKEVENGIG